jgi:hypothetical protein
MRTEGNQSQDAHPVAHPVAASKKSPLTSVNTNLGSANDGAHTGTTPSQLGKKQRTPSGDIEALRDRLSERDLAILRSVAEHQFLTVRQIETLHFADNAPTSGPRIARRALARLRNVRILGTLDRHIGGLGRGSESLIHYVDVSGDQLLRGRSGRRARRFEEPSRRFVKHRLAIADTHVTLIEADRQRRFELVECTVEPSSWRRFAGLGGARLILKPDLYVETAMSPKTEFVHAWFIEVDLSTESIATLLRKCRDYETHRRTGIEQAHGGGYPLVVWSVADSDEARAERRRQALREAIEGDWNLTTALFRVIAPDRLVPLLASGGAA